jgi:hypothetical protein
MIFRNIFKIYLFIFLIENNKKKKKKRNPNLAAGRNRPKRLISHAPTTSLPLSLTREAHPSGAPSPTSRHRLVPARSSRRAAAP